MVTIEMPIEWPWKYKPQPIKREGYWYIKVDSNYIGLGGRKTVYVLIPERARELLKKFGIDLVVIGGEDKHYDVSCEVISEENVPKLIFTFVPKFPEMAVDKHIETSEKTVKKEVRQSAT